VARVGTWLALFLILTVSPGAQTHAPRHDLSKQARLDFIRRAHVWAPTHIAAMDLRAGPQGPGAYRPDELVTCNYVQENLPGTTPKFRCAVAEGDVVKVRYGASNGKLQASVVATRLLWALGFGADRVYPVRVRCIGCSSDPWTQHSPAKGDHYFEHAVIERKPPGHEMVAQNKGGWGWPELDLIDERAGGAPRAQVEALELFATFIQHTDSKKVQERLLCLPGGLNDRGECSRPFMFTHDVGLTFGHANIWNNGHVGSFNFEEWTRAPVWRDATECRAHMTKSHTGTLGDPVISEAGRKFLADLLVQLSDQQLHDVFSVAHAELRSRNPKDGGPPATVDEWVAAFKQKRDEVVRARCSLSSTHNSTHTKR
jgi:hypothetical protein